MKQGPAPCVASNNTSNCRATNHASNPTPAQVNAELERERQAAEAVERERRQALEAQKAELRKLEEDRQVAETAARERAEQEEQAEAARRFQELQVGGWVGGWVADECRGWQCRQTGVLQDAFRCKLERGTRVEMKRG